MRFPAFLMLSAALVAAPSLAAAQTSRLDLQPTRTLAYAAQEGTWMQPDMAPDGKTILFDLLGDIYALDAAGGTARPERCAPHCYRILPIAIFPTLPGPTDVSTRKLRGNMPR